MSQAGLNSINSAVVSSAEQFGLPDSSIITATGSPLEVDFQNGNGISITQGTNLHNIKIALASPSQVISDFDDLLSSNNTQLGKFNWGSIGGAGVTLTNGTATNPGILKLSQAGTGVGGTSTLITGNSAGSFVLGGGSLNINFVFDLVALSDGVNTYTLYLGLMDGTSLSSGVVPVSGCFFKYTNSVNAGNWQIVTEAASVATTANTTTAAATGFHNYGIQINAAATSIAFTINGVTVANSPLTTNIPTAQLMPAILFNVSAGVVTAMDFDLFYYTQNLTTPR